MKFTEEGKYYPTKQGLPLSLTEFHEFGEISKEIYDITQQPSGFGVLLSKEIGRKSINVVRSYDVSDGDSMKIVIKSMAPDKQHQQIDLSKEDYEKFIEVLPDIDGEISVALVFCEQHDS